MCMEDAVDEDKLVLCCALCCTNCSVYPSCDALGASGKAGICCCNLECCLKPGAPFLFPLGCIGCKMESDGCSCCNLQCHLCCVVISAAVPCNEEVPVAITIAGLTLYPKMGCCIKQKSLKEEMSR